MCTGFLDMDMRVLFGSLQSKVLVKRRARRRLLDSSHQMACGHDEHDLSHSQHARNPAEGAGISPRAGCERVDASHRVPVLGVYRAILGAEDERVGAAGGGKRRAGKLSIDAFSVPRPIRHTPVAGEGDAATVEVCLQNVPD